MKKEFYKMSSESNADFKSTCCENILSNLYSLLLIVGVKCNVDNLYFFLYKPNVCQEIFKNNAISKISMTIIRTW